MQAPTHRHPVFEMIPLGEKNVYQLKYKGEIIDEALHIDLGSGEVIVKKDPQEFFDFQAGDLPTCIEFRIDLKPLCREQLDMVWLMCRNGVFEMQFWFFISDEAAYLTDVNPFKTFRGLGEAAERDGYTMRNDGDTLTIKTTIPFGENVLLQYRKHLAVFEGYCDSLEKEMGLRIKEKLAL